MIKITKASAGSGKTYLLAKTYIQLLLSSKDKFPYRHILAVTFTNKATDEMKRRILKELDILSRTPSASPYIGDFRKKFGSDQAISRRASECLVSLLHDYGAFSVSTIDRFFQAALRAFAREIGQFASYQVDIEKEELVHETVDRILDSLSEDDPSLLEWITKDAMEQLDEKGSFRLEDNLYKAAQQIKDVSFSSLVDEKGLSVEKVYSRENLARIHSLCKKISADFEKELSERTAVVLEAFERAGVHPEDTFNRFMLRIITACDPSNGKVQKPKDQYIERARGDASGWFSKANAKKFAGTAEAVLREPVSRLLDLFGDEYRTYKTASLISGQTYGLGIVEEIETEFQTLLKEKNVMSLDDSNEILRKIISGTDAPFIYEKIGVRFEDFLLDEFQDTSLIQWENFRPLIRESEASGNDDLLVGDVKQSIYRFRGGDWNLLDNGVKKDFPEADDSEHLTNNYRSQRAIVSFNNEFFPYAVRTLDRVNSSTGVIPSIYSDVIQKPAVNDESPGSVEATFCVKEKIPEEVLSSVLKAVEAGASLGDITVLVRKNALGSILASYLSENGISVISDESLNIKSSLTVKRLVSILSYVSNPKDKVGSFLFSELSVSIPEHYHSLGDLAEDLLRKLREYDRAVFDSETAYIEAFMDWLMDWVSRNGNNLPLCLKEWSEASASIASPASSDSVRIMTAHKAKGLESEYVIFAYAEQVELFKGDSVKWLFPDLEGTPLEKGAEALYPVTLTSDTADTLFRDDFAYEKLLQSIDNLNIFYVALTRARKGLHIISGLPSGKVIDEIEKTSTLAQQERNTPEFSNFSQILFAFLRSNCKADGMRKVSSEKDETGKLIREDFFSGEMYPYEGLRTGKPDFDAVTVPYLSFPLNPASDNASDEALTDVRERGRMKFSADSVDFFSDEGRSGVEASNRVRGTVLHGILSEVASPADLGSAVRRAVIAGDLTEGQGREAEEILSSAISSVRDLGWFPENGEGVSNEVSVISADGKVYRPDRVVTSGGRTLIIDYKFGEPSEKYAAQVRRYASLYSSMAGGEVVPALWYVFKGREGVVFC